MKSRRVRFANNVIDMGETISVYQILFGKSEGNRLLGKSRNRWIYNNDYGMNVWS